MPGWKRYGSDMGLFSKKSQNQGFTTHLADLALVGGTAVALAQRKGLISGNAAKRLGSSQNSTMSLPQLIIVGSAALRLFRWFRSSRK